MSNDQMNENMENQRAATAQAQRDAAMDAATTEHMRR